MSFFYEIKNPIDDEKKLKDIVKLYSNSKGDFYSVVSGQFAKLSNEEKLKHQINFNKFIAFPAMQEVMNCLKSVDTNIYENQYKKLMNQAKDNKDKQFDIEQDNFHPINKYVALFKKYDAEQLYNLYMQRLDNYNAYIDESLYNNKKKSDQQLKSDHNITDEDIFIVRTIHKLRRQFDGKERCYGLSCQ